MCRSEWQTPQCVTSTSTSVPFGSGVGSSSSCNGLPFSTTAQARMVGLLVLAAIDGFRCAQPILQHLGDDTHQCQRRFVSASGLVTRTGLPSRNASAFSTL